MRAFPSTTFVDNHAHVRIIRRNLMVVFSSAPHASSLDAHGLEWANILLVAHSEPRTSHSSRLTPKIAAAQICPESRAVPLAHGA